MALGQELTRVRLGSTLDGSPSRDVGRVEERRPGVMVRRAGLRWSAGYRIADFPMQASVGRARVHTTTALKRHSVRRNEPPLHERRDKMYPEPFRVVIELHVCIALCREHAGEQR